MTSLLRKKDINVLISHASPLKRTLRTWDLTFLGIGAIIGTGIFVLIMPSRKFRNFSHGAEKAKVAIVLAAAFTKLPVRYFRISYAASMEKLKRAVDGLAKVFAEDGSFYN